MSKNIKLSSDFDISSQLYFSEISKYKSLSIDEELNLWKRYKKNNDIKAKEKLITSNLKFVASVAKNYQGRGLSYSDLIAEGNCGLLKAIDKFDYKKGYKTISYSVWWIKQSILEALKERNCLDGDELPLDYEKQTISDDENEISLAIIQSDSNFIDDNNESELIRKEQKSIISKLTDDLSKKEKNILIKYYGLENVKPMTLEEIGNEIGLTKERIRQILVKIFKKLRAKALMLNISEFLYE
jgi:RNA polymerase primary sigma factor